VYDGVAEISIYIAAQARGQGVGRQLLAALITESEAHDIWTLQAGTFQENAASIGLHTQAGFRIIGYRERIGQHHGVWRNTAQMERRSPSVSVA
jgi:L-amino acid N-acyltransferase YncA